MTPVVLWWTLINSALGDFKKRGGPGGFCLTYLNMMMPPMKVTQRAAPQAVAKQRRCASLRAVPSFPRPPPPPSSDPNVSGENITPTAKNATATTKRLSHPISHSHSPLSEELACEGTRTRSLSNMQRLHRRLSPLPRNRYSHLTPTAAVVMSCSRFMYTIYKLRAPGPHHWSNFPVRAPVRTNQCCPVKIFDEITDEKVVHYQTRLPLQAIWLEHC